MRCRGRAREGRLPALQRSMVPLHLSMLPRFRPASASEKRSSRLVPCAGCSDVQPMQCDINSSRNCLFSSGLVYYRLLTLWEYRITQFVVRLDSFRGFSGYRKAQSRTRTLPGSNSRLRCKNWSSLGAQHTPIRRTPSDSVQMSIGGSWRPFPRKTSRWWLSSVSYSGIKLLTARSSLCKASRCNIFPCIDRMALTGRMLMLLDYGCAVSDQPADVGSLRRAAAAPAARKQHRKGMFLLFKQSWQDVQHVVLLAHPSLLFHKGTS